MFHGRCNSILFRKFRDICQENSEFDGLHIFAEEIWRVFLVMPCPLGIELQKREACIRSKGLEATQVYLTFGEQRVSGPALDGAWFLIPTAVQSPIIDLVIINLKRLR